MTPCTAHQVGFCPGCGLFVGQVDAKLERAEHMMVRLAQARLMGHSFPEVTRSGTQLVARCTACPLAVWVDDGWAVRCNTDVVLYPCTGNEGPSGQAGAACLEWWERKSQEADV